MEVRLDMPVVAQPIPQEQVTLKLSDVPAELTDLYNALYVKVEILVNGGPVFDIKKDPSFLRIVIGSAMTIVENFRNQDGNGWDGQRKRMIALALTKYVINDLAVKGKIDPIIAQEVILNVDFYGGVAIDIAIDIAKKVYDVGQEFVADAQAKGCKAACQENCCCCCVF